MAHYSIKDLERLSGIQAHTIRIWEKRYKLIIPERTDTNIRVYGDKELKKLLNIALLNRNGFKISKIARFNDNILAQRVLEISGDYSVMQNQIDALVIAMIDLNEINFENHLENLIAQYGFDKTIVSVVYPFLSRIGVLWQTGNINVAMEHFVSNIIMRKIIVEIDKLGHNKTPKATFISFLPEWEFHEIGLLFYSYLIKKAGFRSVYLGQSVPVDDLVKVQEVYKAEHFLVSFTTPLPDYTVGEYLTTLAQTFKKCKIYIFGQQVSAIDLKKGIDIIKIKSPEHFEELLQKVK